MNPISPVFPSYPGLAEKVWAKHQPEYRALPSVQIDDVTVTRWRLSWRERLRILWFGSLWLSQGNFRGPWQPQLPEVKEPHYLILPMQTVHCGDPVGETQEKMTPEPCDAVSPLRGFVCAKPKGHGGFHKAQTGQLFVVKD